MKRMFVSIFLLVIIACEGAENGSLQRLMEGNQRFIEETKKQSQTNNERRRATVSRQNPFAVIVACSDSRVAPEIIFDQRIGDLFVVRVAGNVIGPIELESLKYSVFNLGSSVILVLGHQNCGAVGAVVQGKTKEIPFIANLIEPSVEKERSRHVSNLLQASIKENARHMKNLLLNMPDIQKMVENKKVAVYAGYYDMSSGKVEILDK